MNTPRWLRVERQKRAEQERYPRRFVTGIYQENLDTFKSEMTGIWMTGAN